jgi:hypothetical protein
MLSRLPLSAAAMAAAMAAVVALAGCSPAEPPQLMNIRAGSQAPDEFAILPTRALSLPADVAVLPLPGGTDRAASDARRAAVAALGGNPDAGVRDAALVAIARSADPDIRAILATEDAAFRTRFRPRPLERLAGTNVYFRAYGPMTLDAQAELARWRAAGVSTPAAPPATLP